MKQLKSSTPNEQRLVTARRRGPSSKEGERITGYLLLAACDIAVMSGAFLAANLFYVGDLLAHHGLVFLGVLIPIFMWISLIARAYNGRSLQDARFSALRSVRTFLESCALVLFVLFALKVGNELSRAVFGIGSAICLVGIPFVRVAIHRPLLRLIGGSAYAIVWISDGVDVEPAPGDTVLHSGLIGFHVNGSDPMQFHKLAEAVSGADRVIVATRPIHFAKWSSVLKGLRVDGEILTDERDEIGVLDVRRHGQHRTLVVAVGALHLRDRIVKRLFDLIVGTILLICAAPIMLITACAIKLESRGSILFLQRRIGRDNKIFMMYKFRSMFAETADHDGRGLVQRNDERVTRVGRFIRQTSIDELPQLVNVLQGEMSIIGPRPHALQATAAQTLYWDIDPRYRHRHVIKPGLTGLAQVRGLRGLTDTHDDLTKRVSADLEYVRDWSLWRDVVLLFQTFGVLRHDNAF